MGSRAMRVAPWPGTATAHHEHRDSISIALLAYHHGAIRSLEDIQAATGEEVTDNPTDPDAQPAAAEQRARCNRKRAGDDDTLPPPTRPCTESARAGTAAASTASTEETTRGTKRSNLFGAPPPTRPCTESARAGTAAASASGSSRSAGLFSQHQARPSTTRNPQGDVGMKNDATT